MDESVQREKINEAIAELRRAALRREVTWSPIVDAADELIDLLPVEGWPEQLPTMTAVDAVMAKRGGERVQVMDADGEWSPLQGVYASAIDGYWFRIVARVVEPPKPSTERVPLREALGRKVDGRAVQAIDLRAAGSYTFHSGPWFGVDADGMVEVEVLDTETGAG